MNILNEKDQGRIWIPNILFYNNPERSFIRSDSLSSVVIERDGDSINKFSFEKNEFDEFEGNQNLLIYENIYDMQLTCQFEFHFYPFDTQQCFIKVSGEQQK